MTQTLGPVDGTRVTIDSEQLGPHSPPQRVAEEARGPSRPLEQDGAVDRLLQEQAVELLGRAHSTGRRLRT